MPYDLIVSLLRVCDYTGFTLQTPGGNWKDGGRSMGENPDKTVTCSISRARTLDSLRFPRYPNKWASWPAEPGEE